MSNKYELTPKEMIKSLCADCEQWLLKDSEIQKAVDEAVKKAKQEERERIKRTIDEDYFILHADSLQARLDRWEELWQALAEKE